MKYFLDTEFVEGPQDKRFLGIKYGETKPTIDLISIGIVSEDNREYYAVCSDFNVREAWNRHDLVINKKYPMGPEYLKSYWLRDNVLKPIFNELLKKALLDQYFWKSHLHSVTSRKFSFYLFEQLVKYYGKSRETIAEEIKEFVGQYKENEFIRTIRPIIDNSCYGKPPSLEVRDIIVSKPEFYAYYCSYDWVVFCWIFGTMMDLPKGFPMYCNDIKVLMNNINFEVSDNIHLWGKSIKDHPDYPINKNEHHALSDAWFDKELYEFLISLKSYSIEKHTEHDQLAEIISNNLKKSRKRNTIMSDFKSRLKNEFNDLADRSEKLFKYLGSDHYKKEISSFQQEQLTKQYHAMNTYLEILKVRIEDLGIDMSPDYIEAKETVGTAEKTSNSILEAGNTGLTMGAAIDAMKRGLRVRRATWAADSKFIFIQVPSTVKHDIVPKMTSLPDSVKEYFGNTFDRNNLQIDAIYYNDQIAMVGESNLIVAYGPSVSDLLAYDWEILD